VDGWGGGGLADGAAAAGEREVADLPPDVLPLPVAEMDFPIAGPVAEALHAAIRRSDLGYASASPGVAEALAGFTARRWGWQVDPAQVTLAPEVGVAVVEVLRLLVRPGDRVAINPPVYDSFFPWIAEAGDGNLRALTDKDLLAMAVEVGRGA
jgi:bifunctional pyridoxal-dependent enzyme with beta-cystathionase and maltose regulon repressor activities